VEEHRAVLDYLWMSDGILRSVPRIKLPLQRCVDTGLGYLKWGARRAPRLTAGEAQRGQVVTHLGSPGSRAGFVDRALKRNVVPP